MTLSSESWTEDSLKRLSGSQLRQLCIGIRVSKSGTLAQMRGRLLRYKSQLKEHGGGIENMLNPSRPSRRPLEQISVDASDNASPFKRRRIEPAGKKMEEDAKENRDALEEKVDEDAKENRNVLGQDFFRDLRRICSVSVAVEERMKIAERFQRYAVGKGLTMDIRAALGDGFIIGLALFNAHDKPLRVQLCRLLWHLYPNARLREQVSSEVFPSELYPLSADRLRKCLQNWDVFIKDLLALLAESDSASVKRRYDASGEEAGTRPQLKKARIQ